MKRLMNLLGVISLAAVTLVSTMIVEAGPTGAALTQAQVAAQYSALQNAVQSTQAYEGIVVSWSDGLTSDLQSEASAVSSGNKANEKSYASAIVNDSAIVSNDLSATLGWMNSVTYEYQLLRSEESTSIYAREEFPSATTLDDEAILAYNEAESYAAAASSLPSGGSIWGLVCLGIAILAVPGAIDTAGLSEVAAESVQWALGVSGVSCALSAV
jgi:hypothetical protein